MTRKDQTVFQTAEENRSHDIAVEFRVCTGPGKPGKA